jgi:soluble lytic murein transglycosylase
MQVRPTTGRELAKRYAIPWQGPEDLLDPRVNVRLGAAYLSELRSRHATWEATLAAYNMGPAKVRRIKARGGKVPSRYAWRVLRRYQEFKHGLDSRGQL